MLLHTTSISVLKNLIDRVSKAHVQHPINLIQNDVLQLTQVQSLTLQKVRYTTRCADDHIDARPHLRFCVQIHSTTWTHAKLAKPTNI